MRAAEDQRSGEDSPRFGQDARQDHRTTGGAAAPAAPHAPPRRTDGYGDLCLGERLVALARVAASRHMLLSAHEAYDAALPSNRPPRPSFRSRAHEGPAS